MNTNEIWEKYWEEYEYEPGKWAEHMLKSDFERSIPDILSSQWQTREPTREDGDDRGDVLYYDTVMGAVVAEWDAKEFKGCRFMRIPPTQKK